MGGGAPVVAAGHSVKTSIDAGDVYEGETANEALGISGLPDDEDGQFISTKVK